MTSAVSHFTGTYSTAAPAQNWTPSTLSEHLESHHSQMTFPANTHVIFELHPYDIEDFNRQLQPPYTEHHLQIFFAIIAKVIGKDFHCEIAQDDATFQIGINLEFRRVMIILSSPLTVRATPNYYFLRGINALFEELVINKGRVVSFPPNVVLHLRDFPNELSQHVANKEINEELFRGIIAHMVHRSNAAICWLNREDCKINIGNDKKWLTLSPTERGQQVKLGLDVATTSD